MKDQVPKKLTSVTSDTACLTVVVTELVTRGVRSFVNLLTEEKRGKKYEHRYLASPHPSLVTRRICGSCGRDKEEEE